jgi:hypothetical protein
MRGNELTVAEKATIFPGEGITLAAVLSVMVITLIAVVTYRLFMSGDGTVKLPGGYTFDRN